MTTFATEPNVRVKISHPGHRGRPGSVSDNRLIVHEIIAISLPDRAMLASDFPVDSLRGSFDTIYSGFKEIATRCSRVDQEFMFCKTAHSVYRTRQQQRSATA
jgi:predicted TIM-barrel fold metal-dependent hydrolase